MMGCERMDERIRGREGGRGKGTTEGEGGGRGKRGERGGRGMYLIVSAALENQSRNPHL